MVWFYQVIIEFCQKLQLCKAYFGNKHSISRCMSSRLIRRSISTIWKTGSISIIDHHSFTSILDPFFPSFMFVMAQALSAENLQKQLKINKKYFSRFDLSGPVDVPRSMLGGSVPVILYTPTASTLGRDSSTRQVLTDFNEF